MGESRQRLYRTDGIVIRRSDTGEADRILTLYTPQRGKIRAAIKGVRRPGSRMAGHVELLSHSTFVLARGRNLDIVTQAQALETYAALRQDLQRIAWGCYIAELTDRMAPERAENDSAFQLLLEALQRLDQGRNAELVVRSFELHLLGTMGYRPQLFRCVACGAALETPALTFSAAQGGMLCPRCQGRDHQALDISPQALKTLRYLQQNGLAEAERLELTAGLRQEVEGLLYLNIRSILEHDLKAVHFLDTLRQRAAGDSGF